MTRQRGIWIVLFLMAVSAGVQACNRRTTPYTTDTVSRGDIDVYCTATGTVNPITTVLVGTQVSGRIKTILVDFNSRVTTGQLIAEIDPAPFEAQLEEARANLLSAQASVAKAKATLLDAQRAWERTLALYRHGVVGKSELDKEEASLAVARSQVGMAEAQLVQAQAAHTLAQTNLHYTKITSPVDGIVISRNVDVGQTVAATFQTPTLFTIAQDLSRMQVNTSVDEADIGKIAVGQHARFTVDAYPEKDFEGVVTQIRNAPIVVQNVVTYDVIIEVDNPGHMLKPGMTANVRILVASLRNVMRVPNSALRFRPREQSDTGVLKKEQGVWVLHGGKPVFTSVTPGLSDDAYTELRGSGIAEGTIVITGYAHATTQ
ncbi:MAG: efflux RND transporter periplasmic adaptor subunit [Desulfobacterota bacterium]|nr:efflux RND transporter periplasmic adaptor subunit [Thermodesulfobacteriota bacterium]